ncbi:MAG: DNA polymerase IV [Oscillospiraceae bacterium]|nr:DNA polymerase IV [Oscillospiraceae bacterium]
MERIILHCDLNNFFASVECRNRPFLWNEAVAVAGNTQDRHGIILAKNEVAKKFGIRTGETIWQAKRKCNHLVILPPHFDEYSKYSKLAKAIYSEYTDMVEPFGIDECWLDVTGSTYLFGSGEQIAHIIRERIKNELGLTISVGVSFNKIFAKLASDIKKPDAVTIISKENYKDIVWSLPASDIMGVGKSTLKQLNDLAIFTIGDIANCKKEYMTSLFGVRGECMWNNANGYDSSPVAYITDKNIVKSIGNSTTCPIDIDNYDDAWKVILELSEMVSARLRRKKLKAKQIVLTIKFNNFVMRDISERVEFPSDNALNIAHCAIGILKRSCNLNIPIRAIGVRATDLTDDENIQQSFFFDYDANEKASAMDKSIDHIRKKFGNKAIKRCSLLNDENIFRVNKTKKDIFLK